MPSQSSLMLANSQDVGISCLFEVPSLKRLMALALPLAEMNFKMTFFSQEFFITSLHIPVSLCNALSLSLSVCV